MKLAELWVGGSISSWERLGFVRRDHEMRGGRLEPVIVVPDLILRFSPGGEFGEAGLGGWAFVADELIESSSTSIDGIATDIVKRAADVPVDSHRLGIVGVDHVVVMTGSLDRTCAAITDVIGEPLRRTRDAGGGVRQGFHKSGSVILEVVERPDHDPAAPASLWGLVFNVADLDEAVAWLGPDVIGAPRDAVQKGRRIATIRSGASLGVPLALMTPDS